MIVMGANLAATWFGLKLNDGATCIVEDGEVRVAIAEERIRRTKHEAGCEMGIHYCLDSTNLSADEIDRLVLSSCCERPRSRGDVLPISFPIQDIEKLGIRRDRILVSPSHHLSHAYSAFWPSPFERSLVLVLDGEGSQEGEGVGPDATCQLATMASDGSVAETFQGYRYWSNILERQSYYIASGCEIVRIGGEDSGPDDVGVGQAYAFFTGYLGLGAYVNAGKLMGLASYGDSRSYRGVRLFYLDGNQGIRCTLPRLYGVPAGAVAERFMEEFGVRLPPKRDLGVDEFDDRHCNLAKFVQEELERIVCEKVQSMIDRHGIHDVCMAGGVALNCVMNSKVLERTGARELFVQPAAGDQGQCLGNAYYGYAVTAAQPRRRPLQHVFLGRKYTLENIRTALEARAEALSYQELAPSEVVSRSADALARRQFVGWFQGGSEFGPRALGHRSILCSPASKALRDELNAKIKKREWFRPFAASVLAERASDLFEMAGDGRFMLFTATTRSEAREALQAVVHSDGSCRIQTVGPQEGRFRELVSAFWALTGIPALLNTSFNIAGKPIVETPADAIECFVSTPLDLLVIDNILVRKRAGSCSRSPCGG